MTDLVVSAKLTLDNTGYVTAITQADSETKRFAQGAAALSGKSSPLDAAGVDAATRALADSNQALSLTARNAMVLERAEAQLNTQLAKGQISQAQHADALRRVQAELSGTAKAANTAASNSSQLANAVQTVGKYAVGLMALGTIGAYASQALELTEGYQKLQAQLKLTAENSTQLAFAQESVLKTAKATGAPLAETAQLYARLSPAMKEAGYSQAQVVDMSDLVAKSLRLSGATTAESSAAMLQFAQAMGSGVLRGDEFKSMMESAPVTMRKMAEGMDVPVSALRSMAEAGELTADRVAAALLKSKESIDRDFAQMPQTVSMAWQNLTNEITISLGEFNEFTGTTSALASGINVLTENIGTAAAALGVMATSAATLALMTPLGATLIATLMLVAGAATLLAKSVEWLTKASKERYDQQVKALKQQEAENTITREINEARREMRKIGAPAEYEEGLIRINKALREGKISAIDAGKEMNALVEKSRIGAIKLEQAKTAFAAFMPDSAKIKKALADLDADYKIMQANGLANESAYQARRAKIIGDSYKDQNKLRDELLLASVTRELTAEEQKIAALLESEKKRILAANGNETLIRAARASTTEGVKSLMRDEVAATKKAAEDRYKDIKASLDKATAEELRYAGVVTSLQEELAGKRASWADEDRERARASMSESSAQLDRLKEIEEKLKQASEARRSGDEEAAKALAEQSLKLAGNIKNTNDRATAEKNAREVIEASYQAQIEKNVDLGKAATARKNELIAAAEAQQREIDGITSRLTGLDTALKNPRTMDIDTSAAINKLDEVKRKIDAINAAQFQGGSNFTGSNGDGTVFSPSTGTIVAKAEGGRLYGPGTTTSDSILMRGSVDEYVIKAQSARRVGYDVMDYINRTGQLPPGHSTGGRVGQPAPNRTAGVAASPDVPGTTGGNVFHIGQLVLPEVRDVDGFISAIEDRSRTKALNINTVPAGRRLG